MTTQKSETKEVKTFGPELPTHMKNPEELTAAEKLAIHTDFSTCDTQGDARFLGIHGVN